MRTTWIFDQSPEPESHALLGAGTPFSKQSWKISKPLVARCPELSVTCASSSTDVPTGVS